MSERTQEPVESTAPGHNISSEMPLVLETQLANGMRVVSLEGGGESESDVAVVQIRLMTGSALDGDLPGLARFTSSMVTRGSGGRTLDDISIELDGLGASIGVGAGRLTTDASIKSLREDADRVLGILATALRHPDFPSDQAQTVRGQMLTGLRQAENNTRTKADRLMRETIYPQDHPLHSRPGGTEESLAAIDEAALRDFHTRTYLPGRAIVAVAGGLSHQEGVDLVARHFGDWTGAPPEIDVPPVEPPAETVRVEDSLPDKTQADVAMGLPAISRNHPDYYALSVANLILGRFGLYGRLGESVRERQGMAYYAFSRFEGGKFVGTWTANAGVDPKNVDRAIESVIEEIRKFQEEGPTEREFSDAIGSILGSLPLGLETSGSKAATAGDVIFYELGHDFLQRYRGIIRGLTPEQIRDAARRYIDPDRLVIAVVGPEAPQTS